MRWQPQVSWKSRRRCLGLAAGYCLLLVMAAMWVSVQAADPPTAPANYARDLPRIEPVPVEEALGTMEVADGFRLELAAAEPLLASPVAIDWDEDARLFVCEMRGYSENEGDGLGRIRVLTDDNRDGRYDRAEVFAEGFAWPTALCCWGGGVFVGDAPDIFFLKDTDGDGRADERTRVFTGFGTSNVQGLFNAFRVGPDNRIHGSASSTGGEVQRVEQDMPVGEAVPLRGRDFSFDPRTFDLRPETGGAQHGMAFDDCGHRYVCSNSDHAIRCMLEDRYLGRNVDFPAPSGRESIAVEGPQAEVFRISPVEPWRVLRTRLRASGIVPGIVEGGGRPAGYFTSATGITVVRGDAVGDLRGMLVVGDVGSNLVHRKRLVSHGAGVRAERVDEGHELVASRDIWFRPVQFANGPDGALWIIDMQREVIEHPASLPPGIKEHLDLTSGRDAGRLWRLTTDRAAPPLLPPPLQAATTQQLVELLTHANAWQRETAQRLLVQRSDPAAAARLREVLAKPGAEPLGRWHALWTLAGLGELNADDVHRSLQDPAACVRAAAVGLAEGFVDPARSGPPVVATLVAMAAEEASPEVRLQLACAAGSVANAEPRREMLSQLLARDGADRWCRVAACTSMRDGDAAAIATRLIDNPAGVVSEHADLVMPELFAQIGRRGREVEISAAVRAIATLAATDADERVVLAAAGLCRQLSAAGAVARGDATAAKLARRLADACRRIALDQTQPSAARQQAAASLALNGFDATTRDALVTLLHDDDRGVVEQAIDAASRGADADVDALLVEAVGSVSDTARPQVVTAATASAARASLLLGAVADGRLAETFLGPATRERLWRFPDPAVQQQALEVLGPAPPANRQTMVNAYQASLPQTGGDATAGRAVFRQHCVSCHRVEGVGHELGPSLAAMQARGPDAMLLGILDPNREVLPAFAGRTAIMADGRVLTGILVAEGETSVTLRAQEGLEHVLARDDIDDLIDTGRSLMPEGFERSIEPQAMADLLAYLMSVR